jgi:hypothetical protein
MNKRYCKNCGSFTKSNRREFCTKKCYFEYEQRRRVEDWKETGKIGLRTLRRHLLKIADGRCSKCNLNEWMGKPLGVELEHKDGNSANDSPENVCLLCPNCHSQTETYKAKNKGKGRHFRRIRYSEGKSF